MVSLEFTFQPSKAAPSLFATWATDTNSPSRGPHQRRQSRTRASGSCTHWIARDLTVYICVILAFIALLYGDMWYLSCCVRRQRQRLHSVSLFVMLNKCNDFHPLFWYLNFPLEENISENRIFFPSFRFVLEKQWTWKFNFLWPSLSWNLLHNFNILKWIRTVRLQAFNSFPAF